MYSGGGGGWRENGKVRVVPVPYVCVPQNVLDRLGVVLDWLH